jgi:hypothetical protein
MWSSVDIMPAKRWCREPFVRLFLALAVAVATLSVGTPAGRSAAIVNGSPVSPAPSWAVEISGPGGRLCSGALIAPDLVLSAAPGHCPDPARGTTVAAIGRSDATNQGEGGRATIIRSFAHPSQDLGIYELDKTMILPPIEIGSDDLSVGSPSQIPLTLYGYGRITELTEPQVLDHRLRTAAGFVKGECSQDRPRFCLMPQSIQGPCPGDSGGPLVASGVLLGIYLGNLGNLQGVRCVGKSWYAVSVAAPEVKKWVNDTMAANPPAP